MKILHVIGTLDATTGGPPVVVACLAVAQQQLGHDVSIACCPPPNGPEAENKLLSSVAGADELTIHHVPDSQGLDRFLGRAAREQLTPLIKTCDIVHLHGVWEAILVAAQRSAKQIGKPYVIAPHGMLDPWSLSQGKLKKTLAIKLWFARLWRHAAFIHTLNQDEARLIDQLGLDVPTKIIPNGIFLDSIDPPQAPGQFRAAHPELGNDPYILFLSRLHYKKGLDYLADIFKRVAETEPQMRLVVAGPDEGARSDFEQRIHSANLDKRVHVVGPIYGRQKYQAMVDALCFCLPSRQEGFSMAITEALACGAPAVISETCHFPEVGSQQAGYVLPLDPRRFAEAILKLHRDPAEREMMGRNGAAMVRQRYTWPRIAEQSVQAYASVLSTNKSPG